ELPNLEGLDLQELRQVVREHRRARARGDDHRRGALKGAHEAAGDAPRGGVVAAVEGRLAAADLPRWELDLVAGVAQQPLGVLDGVGEDEVADAGREELDARASARRAGSRLPRQARGRARGPARGRAARARAPRRT